MRWSDSSESNARRMETPLPHERPRRKFRIGGSEGVSSWVRDVAFTALIIFGFFAGLVLLGHLRANNDQHVTYTVEAKTCPSKTT